LNADASLGVVRGWPLLGIRFVVDAMDGRLAVVLVLVVVYAAGVVMERPMFVREGFFCRGTAEVAEPGRASDGAGGFLPN
jgi:hypothetical protein